MSNTNINKKNITVLIFRIIAAIFVLICHIGTAINNAIISQFFVAGVQFFLFISGFLYGNKKIYESYSWIKKRYVKIIIPTLAYIIICLIVSLVMREPFSWLSPFLYIFNIQGYYHLFEFIPEIKLVEGTQHLWFLTILFICYLALIVVQRIKINLSSKNKVLLQLIVVVLSFAAAYFGIRLDYILIFFIGYYFGKNNFRGCIKSIIISFSLFAFAVTGRLIMKRYCDLNGDIPVYTNVIVPLSCITMTIFVYFLLDFFVIKTENNHIFNNIYHSKFVSFLGTMTFYIYISHYIFINGNTSVFKFDLNIILKIIIFLLCSIILGSLLFIIDIIFNRLIKRIKME